MSARQKKFPDRARAVPGPFVTDLVAAPFRAPKPKNILRGNYCVYIVLGKHQDSKNRKMFFRDCAIAPKHFPRLRNLSQKIAPSETKKKYRGNLCINSCANETSRFKESDIFSASSQSPNKKRPNKIAESKSKKKTPNRNRPNKKSPNRNKTNSRIKKKSPNRNQQKK